MAGGRQAHGRPLIAGPSGNKNKRKLLSKAKSKALDAYAIAAEQYSEKPKLNPRNRELDADLGDGGGRGSKHGRDDDEDDKEERPRKMRRRTTVDDEEAAKFEDSSGNEWRIGVGEDDDSEIESDDAFGESDEERFADYIFGGSKKAKKDDEDDEDEDIDDADGASLGSDAIDLAAALDMSMSEDEGDDAEAEEEDSDDESSESENDDDDDDISDSGIKDFVSKFSGVKDQDEEEETVSSSKPKSKIDLKDLGLLGINDSELKKSLKFMSKEEKSSKPKKLEVPLARRQQARLDRGVAYEQTNKTLDRWTETVKQNRRAEHLVFPLAQNETGIARHDNSEIQPLNRQEPGTELERAIFGIMEESGLGLQKSGSKNKDDDDAGGQTLSRREQMNLAREKRRERELKSREDAIAKRIKKIKSKTYHRIHRKEREREDIKIQEARAAAGELDSEDEREARDRQRAMERMGARHRESKWAKMKKGHATWDEDVRMGLTEMNRRDQELRQRKEGRQGDGSDDDSDFSVDSDDVDGRKRLLRELDNIDAEDEEESGSKLLNMAFMKRAEVAKKKTNDAAIAQIRRELASSDEDGFDDPEAETEEVGRRSFGQPGSKQKEAPVTTKKRKDKGKGSKSRELEAAETESKAPPVPTPREQTQTTAGAWSSAPADEPRRKRRGKASDSSVNILDLDTSAAVVHVPKPKPASKPKSKQQQQQSAEMDLYSSDDDGDNHAVQFHEQDLLQRAFGGADVVADFAEEKRKVEEEQDEQTIDNTMPGWGSWVGEGVKSREKKPNPRFLKKTEGVNKKDRKDAKLKRVIINERSNKKNTKYMASQLPHQFETAHQYEYSLRLPVGPEWVTKETFQNATKPRVIVKQGIIAPMAKPMH